MTATPHIYKSVEHHRQVRDLQEGNRGESETDKGSRSCVLVCSLDVI